MFGDEFEKIDEAALPRRPNEGPQPRQPDAQCFRSKRRICRLAQNGEPRKHIRLRIIRRAAFPEGDFDQAVRINQVAIRIASQNAPARLP